MGSGCSPKLCWGGSHAAVLTGPQELGWSGLRAAGAGGSRRLVGRSCPVLCPEGLVCRAAGAQGGGGLWGPDRRLDPGPLCLVTAARELCRVGLLSEKRVKAARVLGGQGGGVGLMSSVCRDGPPGPSTQLP